MKVSWEKNENGVYCMGSSGGTGKSFLYKIIKDYSSNDSTYLALTYDRDLDIVKVLNSRLHMAKLVVLDRADLYMSEEIYNLLNEYSDNALILIDYKGEEFYFKRKRLYLNEGLISIE